MVLEGDRLVVEEGSGVGRGVPAVGDGDAAEVLGRGAVLVHVAAGLHRDRRGRRGQAERVGPGVVEAVGVHLHGRPVLDLAEALPGPLVEAPVGDDDVGDPRRDGHRGLLDGGARRAAAVVDPAEEAQLRDAELAGHRDLGRGVHGEGDEAVDVRGRQGAVGERMPDRLDGELQLGATGLLGELGGADARDRGLAGEGALAHAACPLGSSTVTVPMTCSPSETAPTTLIVATPSSTAVTSPVNVNVS